jgi:hypothetical protein
MMVTHKNLLVFATAPGWTKNSTGEGQKAWKATVYHARLDEEIVVIA